jgi:hypothetical protein
MKGRIVNKIVVWGLKSVIDSYKFIQKSFYENARLLGYEAVWVDDLETNQSLVNRGDIVFAVDRARRHLPIRTDAKYVLHNISSEELKLEKNFINIQVFRKDSIGTSLGIHWVQWDESSRTLFQPWGIPIPPKLWKIPRYPIKKQEYWVGSIWNDSENRGNSEFMKKYIQVLAKQEISFYRKGTPTRLQPNGISEGRGQKLVNRSVIGAAVVGEWQKENLYVPCRLFKNIAAGAPPSSNSDFSLVFGDVGGIFEPDPELLIARVLSLSKKQREEIVLSSQAKMIPYTYSAGMNRIFNFLV